MFPFSSQANYFSLRTTTELSAYELFGFYNSRYRFMLFRKGLFVQLPGKSFVNVIEMPGIKISSKIN